MWRLKCVSLEQQMSKAPYNSEKFNNYLLGSLSAEETEQLDELSITDAEFAGALVASESELIDAYLLNELDGEVRKKFENRYLATPVRREKVRFAETLQQFGSQEQLEAISQADVPGWLSRLKFLLGRQSVLRWGFATAALVLLVAGIWLVFQNIRLRSEVLAVRTHNNELAQSQQQLQRQLDEAQRSAQARVEQPNKPEQPNGEKSTAGEASSSSVLSLVFTPLLRGGRQKNVVNLGAGTTALRVELVLEPNDFSSYRVELLPLGQGPVWRAVNLKAQEHNGARSLVVTLPISVLKVEDYVLRVSSSAQNGTSELIGDYPFTISRAHRVN